MESIESKPILSFLIRGQLGIMRPRKQTELLAASPDDQLRLRQKRMTVLESLETYAGRVHRAFSRFNEFRLEEEPYVLYLRSFGLEPHHLADSKVPIADGRIANVSTFSLEDPMYGRVLHLLRSALPAAKVVTATNPTTYTPTLHHPEGRLVEVPLLGADWRDLVRALIKGASAVVIYLERLSEGVSFELEAILSEGCAIKTVAVLVSPSAEPGTIFHEPAGRVVDPRRLPQSELLAGLRQVIRWQSAAETQASLCEGVSAILDDSPAERTALGQLAPLPLPGGRVPDDTSYALTLAHIAIESGEMRVAEEVYFDCIRASFEHWDLSARCRAYAQLGKMWLFAERDYQNARSLLSGVVNTLQAGQVSVEQLPISEPVLLHLFYAAAVLCGDLVSPRLALPRLRDYALQAPDAAVTIWANVVALASDSESRRMGEEFSEAFQRNTR